MAITIAETVSRAVDTPQHRKVLQKILRQQELQEKLLREASAHLQILEEHRRFQQLTTPYGATLAQSTQAELLQAQITQAQVLQTQVLQTQALQTVDGVARETGRFICVHLSYCLYMTMIYVTAATFFARTGLAFPAAELI